MLHMIRQIIGNSTFKGMLHGLSTTFYHETVSTEQILSFINQYTKKDFAKIFDQYLRTTKVPLLEYSFKNNVIQYRWTNCVNGFNMPVKVSFNNQSPIFIFPTDEWKILAITLTETKKLTVDRNFYVQAKENN